MRSWICRHCNQTATGEGATATHNSPTLYGPAHTPEPKPASAKVLAFPSAR
jgi:hypothetical protein